MACSLSLAPLASVHHWWGRSTAGPFHYPTWAGNPPVFAYGAVMPPSATRHIDGQTTILDLVGPHFAHVYVWISLPSWMG
jgi:hypothetical protein